MEVRIQKANVYVGIGAGKPIREGLDNAKRCIDIISPYLTHEYANYLVKRHKEGVEVNLVTSADFTTDKKEREAIVRALIEQRREEIQGAKSKCSRYKIYGICLMCIAALAASSNFWNIFPVAIPGCFVVAGILTIVAVFIFHEASKIRLYSYRYVPRINLMAYVPGNTEIENDSFAMNSKVYVFDRIHAYLGSIDLTTSSFNHNCETRIDVEDEQASFELSETVRDMIQSPWGKVKEYDEIGREFFEENYK